MTTQVTMCWRSVWMVGDLLIEGLLLPEQPVLGAVLSLLGGTSATVLFRAVTFLTRPNIQSHTLHFTVSRLFTLTYFTCYMLVASQ